MERNWSRGVTAAVTVALLALSSAWVISSADHPLLGRPNVWQMSRGDQYFIRVPLLRQPFLDVVALARRRQCERIGLVLGWDDVEYPLWALLGEGGSRPRIEHVNVDNLSARVGGGGSFSPCLVVSVRGRNQVSVEVRD
jgi:hypothetical protein